MDGLEGNRIEETLRKATRGEKADKPSEDEQHTHLVPTTYIHSYNTIKLHRISVLLENT
jgi:hypothetical protein